MKCLFFSMLIFGHIFSTSIYDYEIQSTRGETIDLDNFRGKKIMLVNIATGNPKASQLRELQQLHEQYGDSLVIIGFPSDSFDKEAGSNSEIEKFCRGFYGVTFYLAAKGSVKGDNIQPVYQWLTQVDKNGEFNEEIKEDFQKYIISPKGELIGIFAGATSPISEKIISVVTANYN